MVCEWGSIFVFTSEKKLYQLTEKDTQTKLESLFKKNLYAIAINLAQAQQFDLGNDVHFINAYVSISLLVPNFSLYARTQV